MPGPWGPAVFVIDLARDQRFGRGGDDAGVGVLTVTRMTGLLRGCALCHFGGFTKLSVDCLVRPGSQVRANLSRGAKDDPARDLAEFQLDTSDFQEVEHRLIV
jgi:hypothetical protein